MDVSWNRKPKMCGDGHCYNVSYKTRLHHTPVHANINTYCILLIVHKKTPFHNAALNKINMLSMHAAVSVYYKLLYETAYFTWMQMTINT